MFRHFKSILSDTEGATAIEYGLIAALISVTLIAGATTLGNELSSLMNRLANQLRSAVP